jgi:xanthine dehydrogenase iron-sulfur cluster and FAD-binding subunit A
MIPAPFDYVRAGSVDEAISLLGSREDAKLLAGGHSLLPAMKLRVARPSTLVDIGRIGGLSYVREDGDRVAIGALTRHHDVANAEALQELCPIVAHAAGRIGDPQVRHMGTIGGSVAHGDPARRPAGGAARARRGVRRAGTERHPDGRRDRLLHIALRNRRSRPTRSSRRSASRRRTRAGAS